MILSKNERLNYPVQSIVENNKSIVIDGTTYDSKSLKTVSSEKIEVGFLNNTNYNNGITVKQILSPISVGMLSQCYINGILNSMASVVDISDPNIIWSITGDSLIRYNATTKKYSLKRVKDQQIITNPAILYQDSNYIYFIDAGDQTNTTSDSLYARVIKKDTEEILLLKTVSSMQYMGYFHVLKIENNIAYIHISSLGSSNCKILTMGSGDFEIENSLTITFGASTQSLVSNMSGSIFYSVSNAGKMIEYTVTDKTITKTAEANMFDNSKILIDDILKEKYNLENITEVERKQYLNLTGALGNYTRATLFVDGLDENFIVLIKDSSRLETITEANLPNAFISVFKRNNKNIDNLDLTLTDIFRFNDFNLKMGSISRIYRVSNNTYFGVGSFGVMEIKISTEGKISYKIYYNNTIQYFGIDSNNRKYIKNKINTNTEIFSDKLACNIKLDYENESDSTVIFEGNDIIKKIRVQTTNMWGENVKARFKLYLVGNGVFNDTQTTYYTGDTDEGGQALIQFTIKSPNDITFGSEIIYNKELEIVS